MHRFISIWLLLLGHLTSVGQLQINEVCSKNESLANDLMGNYPDFVELMNIGNTSIDLSEYHLSDNDDNLLAWQLPQETLEPNELIIIWCDNSTVSPWHSNFQLSSGGDELFLTHDGDLVDQVLLPALRPNHTYGRPHLSDNWVFFQRGTPGEINDTEPLSGHSSPPEFILASGFYEHPIALDFVESVGAIFYSTDGSDPRSAGIRFQSSVVLDSTLVIRAATKEPGKLWSEISTQTFFIGIEKQLPVFSISCEPMDLWDPEVGIYVLGNDADSIWPFFGANYWDGRQIEVNVEYFENQIPTLNQRADMQIHGGKGARNQPQKALRLTARERHGAEYFDHPFIPHKDLDQYKKLVLRNSGGDFNKLHFRDGWIIRHCHTEGLDIDLLGFEPAVVFLNGEYFGIQNIREKVDRHYCRTNGGYDEDVTYDILEKDTLVIEGSRADFDDMVNFFVDFDLSDPSNFAQAAQRLDVPSFTDYIIAETFWNNTDWPTNNTKYYRPNSPEGPWRFIIFDMDVSLNAVGYVNEETDNLGRILNDYQFTHQVKLLSNLLENPEYKIHFINRYADLINTSFDADYMVDDMLEFLYSVEHEMAFSRPRWGSSLEWWWSYHIEPRTLKFLEYRSAFARDQVQSNFELAGQYRLDLDVWPPQAGSIDLNTLSLHDLPWDGIYYDDVPIQLNANPEESYQFSHWIVDGQEVFSSASLQRAFNSDAQVIAVFSESTVFEPLRIYPNPNTGDFSLDFIKYSESQSSLEIFDTEGRLVYESLLGFANAGVHSRRVNTQLAAGAYTLVLHNGTAQEKARMVIVD
jgi:hypothetical protein